ncbi:cytochrome P450 [Thelonectria olida]|uniref:Cytochrome P450 n=1 Tax=Thelonectria olida TaxID=1576542 RepID=A0A9P8W184_9HYPO|nr:cytochrome P450 [Thelonectria olida]
MLYYASLTIYNLYFHPLSKYPGPKLASVSNLWYVKAWMSGRYPFTIQQAHHKYGDVIRISPNELSFVARKIVKSKFYDTGEKHLDLAQVQDPEEHQRQRKMLARAFSLNAIHNFTDKFLQQIGKMGCPKGPGIDVKQALNWLTQNRPDFMAFERERRPIDPLLIYAIPGDLAFGESFGAVESGKTHFWVSLIVESTYFYMFNDARKRFPLINLALLLLIPRDPGPKEGTISEQELKSQANTLIIAGSETTSMVLTGLVCFLLQNKPSLDKLIEEASLDEGLRLFPPIAFGPPRVSPGATVAGQYIPPGVIVSVDNWSVGRDPRNFRDPDSFLPERWLDRDSTDNKASFQPFSLGLHACIGMNLANLEMRIILAKMVWMYDWELISTDLDSFQEAKLYLLWKKPSVLVRFHLRGSME